MKEIMVSASTAALQWKREACRHRDVTSILLSVYVSADMHDKNEKKGD